MKQLGVFLLPLNGMQVRPSQVTPPQFVSFLQQFAGTHLYFWVERDTGRVKCPLPKNTTVFPSRARTRTAGIGFYHGPLYFSNKSSEFERLRWTFHKMPVKQEWLSGFEVSYIYSHKHHCRFVQSGWHLYCQGCLFFYHFSPFTFFLTTRAGLVNMHNQGHPVCNGLLKCKLRRVQFVKFIRFLPHTGLQ